MDLLKNKVTIALNKNYDSKENLLEVANYIAPIIENIEFNNQLENKVTRKLVTKNIEIQKNYLEEFENINSLVHNFNEVVHELNKKCTNLYRNVENVRLNSSKLIKKSADLNDSRIKLISKCQKIDNFIEIHSLSEEEKNEIKNCADNCRLTEQFFKTISHAKEIRENCKKIIQKQNCVAAFEISEQLHNEIERCNLIIFNSFKSEISNFSIENIQKTVIISKSFEILHSNKFLFETATDHLIDSRSTDLLNKFVTFLTGSNIQKSCSIRFVTDILTFIHEITEIEKCFLKSLFSLCEIQELFIENSLNKILKSIGSPFRTNLENIIINEKNIVSIHKISSVFDFYKGKYCDLIHIDNHFSKILEELNTIVKQIFLSGLNFTVENYMEKIIPQSDLLPAKSVRHCLFIFEELIKNNSNTSTTPLIKNEDIFKYLIEPLIQNIQINANYLNSKNEVLIFIINCLTIIENTISKYKNVTETLGIEQIIEEKIEKNSNLLILNEVHEMLKQSHLLEIFNKMKSFENIEKANIDLSEIEGLENYTISAALVSFAQFLHLKSETTTKSIDLNKLLNNKKSQQISEAISTNFLEAYKFIIKNIENSSKNYKNINFLSIESVENILNA